MFVRDREGWTSLGLKSGETFGGPDCLVAITLKQANDRRLLQGFLGGGMPVALAAANAIPFNGPPRPPSIG